MKKSKNVLLSLLFAGILMAMLSGCGKSGNESQEEGKEEARREGSVYVPEYVQMGIKCNYMNVVAQAGDSIFISAESYDENAGTHSSELYQYDLLENKAELVPVEMDENSSISGTAVSKDGNLLLVINHWEYIRDENGEIVDGTSTLELRSISAADGAVIDSRDVGELLGNSDSEYRYIQHVCMDAQENLYLCDGDGTIHIFDKDLQKLCEITADGWIDSMVVSREGDVYISFYGNGRGKEFKKVDVAGKVLGESMDSISEMGFGGDYFAGISKSLLVSSQDKVFTLDLETETLEELFKWLDVDVNSDNVGHMGELSDGRIWAITREYFESGDPAYELIYLSQKDAAEVTVKEELVFGTLWLGSDLRKSIIDFNKTNTQYHISVKEYASEDYEAGWTQFNADLTTANCPDILDLSSLDFEQYASKGVLEDLYPYMEKSGVNKEDYLENILKAYEMDGKLYGLMSKFFIMTTLAKSSLVGGEGGWTLSEMLDFVEKNNPENVFQYGNRSSIFYYCIYNNIDEFIDWETGKCFFDGEEFIRTLEFASQFPEDYSYDEEREGIASLLHADKVLLMQTSLSSVQEYQMMNGLFGEKVTYVGYPNSERKGNMIQSVGGSVGMSAKSGHKDGAWEYMKTMISKEYQDSLVSEHGWGFPVSKSSLEKQFELDMKVEYYEDEEGSQVEQMKTSWGYDDFQMDIYAATPEEIQAVRELVTSAEKISGNIDSQLSDIITEEAEPFFKGQKSAADVAGIIQNRIQIYVNENR